MVRIAFKMSVKSLWFNTEKVKAATSKATRKVLAGFGRYVQKGVRFSIRKRKKPSAPGNPPHSHNGTLKRFIRFEYEPSTHNVVIGPIAVGGKRLSGDGKPMPPRTTTPEVLEKGGGVQIIEYQREFTPRGRKMVLAYGHDPDAWHRMGKKRIGHKKGRPLRIKAVRQRVISVAPRPFMGPVFKVAKSKLPAMWRDSVKA